MTKEFPMKHCNILRRDFLKKSGIIIGATGLPINSVFSATAPLYVRPEWKTFKNTSHYFTLIQAITTMKGNTNANDPASWSYWTNIHVNYCPHGISYFLGWHRGYLYHFEQQIRLTSGDLSLILPYWDYYSDSRIPSEFTDSRIGNPLYVERINTNVYQALTMSPFSSTLLNFPRGMNRAFEPNIEVAPHNPIHDLIGGAMTTMQSPVDPIFWLHHANIDRLWVAWVAAGGGRKMPLKTSSYWGGSFIYGNTLTLPRTQAYDTRSTLNYYYQNEIMPTKLPQLADGAEVRIRKVQSKNDGMSIIPPTGNFRFSDPRVTGDTTFSTGGTLNIGLNEQSLGVQIPISAEHGQVIAQIAQGIPSKVLGGTTRYKSVDLVLDSPELTPMGSRGGYFYNVYLNLPGASGDTTHSTRATLIGTLGPFQIAAAGHHHAGSKRLSYPITLMLQDLSSFQIAMFNVSFVRIDGDNSPIGPVIGIGEVRIELSTESNF